MAGKQAKVLSDAQIKRVLNHLQSNSRNSERNVVMFMLSLHGLRAKEIANLTIEMVTDVDGNISDVIQLQDKATKGKSGRVIPMRESLHTALETYLSTKHSRKSSFVIETERSKQFSANAVAVFFKRLYQSLGMSGASSHSGRRTFITNCARKISLAGGSLRDVQLLAGHRSLNTTSGYIAFDSDAQKKVLEKAFSF